MNKKNNKLLQSKTDRIDGISDDKFALKSNGLDLLNIIKHDENWTMIFFFPGNGGSIYEIARDYRDGP